MREGFFRNALNQMMAARERQARLYVNKMLAMQAGKDFWSEGAVKSNSGRQA